jgi:hypothetical protein
VFFVALATLMLEITLARLFSVTIWYHFGAWPSRWRCSASARDYAIAPLPALTFRPRALAAARVPSVAPG